ncbi:hypothetical protein Sjap_006944 [Stephania japonica]|uniref:Uncharacterized protein n=1 Tax=Stephania japonica TaxID=461633 RepID=A0AAP0PNB2_9MAGN
MPNMFSSFKDFDYDVLDHYDHQTRDLGGNEGIFEQGCEEVDLFGGECWEELGDFCSDYGFHEEQNALNEVFSSEDHHHQQQQQKQATPFFNCEMINDFQFSMASPSPLIQMPQELEYSTNVGCIPAEILDQESNKEESQGSSLTSMELLKSAFAKKINGERLVMTEKCTDEKACITSNTEFKRLSTEEVMRVAGALLLQFYEQNGNSVDHANLAMLMQPFSCDRIGLTEEETNDVKLARLLIAAAEKVGNKQFDQASKLLTKCDYLSSTTGTPVQRVVYQFGEALRERINRQTGRVPMEDYFLQERKHLDYVEEALITPNSALLACHQLLPFCKVLNFAGIQAVIDNIASAKKVHFIQIGIKIGIECSILMQALASRQGVPLEHFKLTTIVTRNQKKVEETCKRLASFADSMDVPFISMSSVYRT